MDSVLKLILVVCRQGRRGWIWIETSSFNAMPARISKKQCYDYIHNSTKAF